MKRVYMFLLILVFGCLCARNTRVYAMEKQGFETEEISINEIELFLDNINIILFNTEPGKMPIKCFDVNEQGMVAIGTEDGNDKTICLYSDDGDFQYGYRFKASGSFGVELSDEALKIYFVRSDVAVSVDSTGKIQNVLRICDTSENNTYWNRFVRATSRNVGEYQYILKNDIGILGIFASTYSQLYKTDRYDNELLIYDANTLQFFNILIMFLGILVFVCIVVVVIIKEYKKLQESNMQNK